MEVTARGIDWEYKHRNGKKRYSTNNLYIMLNIEMTHLTRLVLKGPLVERYLPHDWCTYNSSDLKPGARIQR